MKRFIVIVSMMLISSTAFSAKYGMAGCGIGSMAFGDEPGMIQIVAAILNNLIVPQTSAITSGTSNCFDSRSDMASLFMIINKEALKREIARGDGETINGLAKIYKCQAPEGLGPDLQSKFSDIYSNFEIEVINKAIHETIVNSNSRCENLS